MENIKSIIKDFTLFLSAFVPMFVLIFLRLVIDIINHNLSFTFLNSLNFSTLLLLIAIGAGGLYWNMHTSTQKKEIVIIQKQNITDKHFLGYFSLFVLFALQLDLSFVSGYIIFIFIMIFIGIVYIKNSLFYINPLLNIMGYNFYDVEYKIEGKNQTRQAKIFHKGDLECNKKYNVFIKNDNFTFIDSKSK